MSIKHIKVSTQADGSDPNLVQPSNWNENHRVTYDIINTNTTLTQDQQFVYCSTETVSGGASDPYFGQVSMLMPFESDLLDTTGKNTFTVNGVVLAAGSPSSYGTNSAYIGSTTNNMATPMKEDLIFNGDFTIEFWFSMAAGNSGNHHVINATGGAGYEIRMNGLNIEFFSNGSSVLLDNRSINGSNTHYHIALVRNSGNMVFYVNGTVGTVTATNNDIFQAIDTFYIGSTQSLVSSIKDLRITKGVARYTSSFTPNTSAFPTYAGLLDITLPSTVVTGQAHRIDVGYGPYIVNLIGGTHTINGGTSVHLPLVQRKEYVAIYNGSEWRI